MAKKKDKDYEDFKKFMSSKKSSSGRSFNTNNITPVGGALYTDSSLSSQPSNTNRFALNAVSETEDGDLGFTSNERGTSVCAALPEAWNNNHVVVGHINLLNDEAILFLAPKSNALGNDFSIIAKQTKDCKIEVLIKARCLSFSPHKHIKGKWRLLNGCETVIYFVDGVNTDKAINLSRLGNYTLINPLTQEPYTAEEANLSNLWNCNLMKLEADYLHPCIELQQVNPSGGKLEMGMYQFAVQYSDNSQNLSNFTTVSDNIPITEYISNGISTDNYNQIEGGDSTLENATNNSISITIKDLDPNYPFFNLAVIETINGTSNAYQIATLETQNTINYTYRGTTNNSIPILLTDISINNVTYESSETLEIAENRLFRANLKEKNINWGKFQQQANNIRSYYFTKPLWWSKGDVYRGAKDANVYFDTKSYMRDEVYAFAVVWIFNDGTESPAFHIPGREKNKYPTGVEIPFTSEPCIHNRFASLLPGQWDSSALSDSHDEVSLINTDERWQIYNTALRTYPSGTTTSLDTPGYDIYAPSEDRDHLPTNDYTKGVLAYFESDLNYPDDSCDGERIYPEGKIRFHKMPDTTLEPHFTTVAVSSEVFGDYNDQFTLQLGVDFENIIPPSDYADQIQGYYIVRSQRDGTNKTVIDKGIVYHNVKHHYNFATSAKSSQPVTYNKPTDVSSLTTTFDTQNWTMEPYAFHTQTCLGNRHWWHDGVERSSLGSLATNYGTTLAYDTLAGNRIYIAHEGHTAPHSFSNNNSHEVSSQYYDVFNVSFHSPISKFQTQDLSASYLKVENKLSGKYVGKRAHRANGASRRRMSQQLIDYTWIDTNRQYKTNYLIDQHFSVDAHNIAVKNSINFVNKQQQEAFVLIPNIENPIPHFDRSEEETIEYSKEGKVEGTLLDNNSTCIYGSLKIENPSIYGAVTSINYIKTSKCIEELSSTSTRVFGGDTFISKFAPIRNYTSFQLHDTNDETLWKQIPYFFVESEINTELRHEFRASEVTEADTNFPCTTYFPKESSNNLLFEWDFERWIVTDWSNASNEQLKTVISKYIDNSYCKNYYQYNSDFSRENVVKPYFPLQLGYNYCSDCNNHYPHRIVYSQIGNQEQSTDFFKNFLANSYEDLEGNNGFITDIFYFRDVFYMHTEQNLFARKLQPQQLETTDGDLINLGDATVFAAPVQNLNSVPTGYAGNQHKQALAISESGVFFPDADSGKIFLLSKSLTELSDQGERNFFEENLPSNFLKQFYELTGKEWPYEGVTSNLSVGLQSAYDTRHKRWIITKKDYNIISNKITYNTMDTLQNLYEDIENGNVPFNELIFNPTLYDTFFTVSGDTYLFTITDGIDFTNATYFENKSWTKSYCNLIQGWKSYHSYLPNYIYGTQSKLFSSVIPNSNLWEHNIGEFQTYYGVKKPFIVEPVTTLDQVNTYTSPVVGYLANVLEFDSTHEQWLEVDFDTFNKGVFYSTNQSSGLVNLTIKNNNTPFASINNTPGSLLVNKEEKNWSINNIRNNVTDNTQPLFTKNWSVLQGGYFIDKEVNNNVIDFNKSLFTKEKLRDKFMVCRFIYDNPQNRKFNFKYMIDKSKVSYR